jgi:hypothetical protein
MSEFRSHQIITSAGDSSQQLLRRLQLLFRQLNLFFLYAPIAGFNAFVSLLCRAAGGETGFVRGPPPFPFCRVILGDVLTGDCLDNGKRATSHHRIGVPKKRQCEFNSFCIGIMLQNFQSHQTRHSKLIRHERSGLCGGKPFLFFASARWPALKEIQSHTYNFDA